MEVFSKTLPIYVAYLLPIYVAVKTQITQVKIKIHCG